MNYLVTLYIDGYIESFEFEDLEQSLKFGSLMYEAFIPIIGSYATDIDQKIKVGFCHIWHSKKLKRSCELYDLNINKHMKL